jgi:hypothetical protein
LAVFEDHFFKEELCRKILEFKKTGTYFSLNSLLQFSKEELEFNGSRSTLHKILKLIGFRYKLENHRKILIERPFITAKRIEFLKQYLRYKEMYPNIKFVYLDETWIYQHGSVRKTWVNANMPTKQFKIKKSEGRRYTVLHAGSSTGFLDGCSLLLASSNNDRDYHKTMNSTIFKKWVIDQLIPAVTLFQNDDYKVVVVMDNAPYHSVRTEKPPTRSAKKSVLHS